MFDESGDGDDFITIVMTDGAIAVTISLGTGLFESHISTDQGRQLAQFDDNEWHELVVSREAREVSCLPWNHGSETG